MTNGSETAVVVALGATYGPSVIARRDGRVVFVKGAIPGERVRIRLDERKTDYDTATVIGIEEPSPHRVTPACGHFGACGGCHLQHLSHPGQLILKQNVLNDCLTRIGGIEAALSPSLHGVEPWSYRVRGQFKVGGASIGFFRGKSRDVVNIDRCPLMTGQVNEGLRVLKETLGCLLPSFPGDTLVTEAHITCGDVPVALLGTRDAKPAPRVMQEVASRLIEAGFAGVVIGPAQGKMVSKGASRSTFKLGPLSYSVSPLTFLQSHWQLNQEVVKFLKDSLRPLGGKRVVDLYAGAGNFSLPLCGEAGEVISVESHPWAVRDGRGNIVRNRIPNCRFVRSDAEGMPQVENVDVLILDPPRTGLTRKATDRIRKLRASRIVYISCNPATLARDLKKLLELYRLHSVRAIDFFPQTYHIESLTVLELK